MAVGSSKPVAILYLLHSTASTVSCVARCRCSSRCPRTTATGTLTEQSAFGDAIADGTDLHGVAVNTAARLQAICPPGAICVSRAVRDHVHGRLNLEFT